MPVAELAEVEGINLFDPTFYTESQYEVYGRLRREAPLYWHELGGFWVLTRYEDIKAVSRQPNVFANGYGVTIGDHFFARNAPDPLPEELEALLGDEMPRIAEVRRAFNEQKNARPDGKHLLNLDPPRHNKMRRLMSTWFTPRAMAPLERWIRELTEEALDEIETGTVVDLVDALSVRVPIYVIAEFLGIPRDMHSQFKHWTDAILEFPEDHDPARRADLNAAYREMYDFFADEYAARRAQPRDDLLSKLVEATVDDEALGKATLQTLAMSLVAAGNGTTRDSISGGVIALAQHPDQRELLTKAPETLATAVDEIVRWVTPIISFCRTVRAPTELHGTTLEPGDYVALIFASGNRDEEQWDRPDRFDVTRKPDPMHLSFGYAQHMCIGAGLARLEIRIVFEELLRRFPRFELAGEVVKERSTNHVRYGHVPVLFS